MIRIANENDLKSINDLIVDEDYQFNQNDFISEVNKILVLVVNDKIIGVIKYTILYERSELEYLYIDTKYRRKNMASELMNYLFNDLLNSDCKSITLEVAVDNLGALKLYDNFGCKKIGLRKGYYNGKDAILMERKLM